MDERRIWNNSGLGGITIEVTKLKSLKCNSKMGGSESVEQFSPIKDSDNRRF